MSKIVVITGIDSVGKTSTVAELGYPSLKYPMNKEIKDQINQLYAILTQGGKELNSTVIQNIYRQIHDLYDRDLKLTTDVQIPDPSEPVIVLDRYYIDNIVYSRINGVEKPTYSEGHIFSKPDLVIMLKVRDYKEWKEKFILKGDENIREPAILFEEVQRQFQITIKELYEKKYIKKYTIIQGLRDDTVQRVQQAISDLLEVECETSL